MLKGLIYWEELISLIVFLPQKRPSKYVKQKLTELKSIYNPKKKPYYIKSIGIVAYGRWMSWR